MRRFQTPTEPQEQGWPHILAGKPTLISAPTGSGKTLAAFLIAIDGLLRKAIDGRLDRATEVVYVSPLKALSNDVQKNLETPLREIQATGAGAGISVRADQDGGAHGRYAAGRAAGDAEAAAAHPGDDSGVAVHSADVGEEPAESAAGAHGDRG